MAQVDSVYSIGKILIGSAYAVFWEITIRRRKRDTEAGKYYCD